MKGSFKRGTMKVYLRKSARADPGALCATVHCGVLQFGQCWCKMDMLFVISVGGAGLKAAPSYEVVTTSDFSQGSSVW